MTMIAAAVLSVVLVTWSYERGRRRGRLEGEAIGLAQSRKMIEMHMATIRRLDGLIADAEAIINRRKA